MGTPFYCPTLCFKKIRVPPKIGILPSGNVSLIGEGVKFTCCGRAVGVQRVASFVAAGVTTAKCRQLSITVSTSCSWTSSPPSGVTGTRPPRPTCRRPATRRPPRYRPPRRAYTTRPPTRAACAAPPSCSKDSSPSTTSRRLRPSRATISSTDSWTAADGCSVCCARIYLLTKITLFSSYR